MEKIASVIVASKSDLDKVSQRFSMQPDQYCTFEGLPFPISISAKNNILADLTQTLLTAAINPTTALPPNTLGGSYRKQALMGSVVAATVTVVAISVFYWLRNRS